MAVRTGVDPDTQHAVTDVIVRYATAIDRRDWDLFRTCFTEDVEADYGHVGVWHDRDGITDWAIETHRPLGPTMHRITNVVAVADADRVAARSYVDVIALEPNRSMHSHAAAYYDDELVRTEEGWKIARRTMRMVWIETTLTADTRSLVI